MTQRVRYGPGIPVVYDVCPECGSEGVTVTGTGDYTKPLSLLRRIIEASSNPTIWYWTRSPDQVPPASLPNSSAAAGWG